MSSLFVRLQPVLPHHLISRVVLWFTRLEVGWIKNPLLRAFIRSYKPDLSDAEQPDAYRYASFNAFFTRALRSGARPLAGTDATVVSPVDGTLSQFGAIDFDRLIQAKGHSYSLDSLLAGAAKHWATKFRSGVFSTIYLAPYNYHRIHMPISGSLQEIWYVPGRLFAVNSGAVAGIPNLFARNERLVLLFEGECGAFAVIFVGALNVGSMATVWHGDVTPRRPREVTQLPLPQVTDRYRERGAEIGRFNMGSTVILLFAPSRVNLLAQLQHDSVVRLGQALGDVSTTHGSDWISPA
jgi:phosphatidylserine decarboxylase